MGRSVGAHRPVSSDRIDLALAPFEAALPRLPASATHLVPDLVLRSYLHDLHENAQVVRLLLRSELGYRAFPNARSCFEAAQLAALLASDPDYDLAGAKAWVYAHRKDLALAKRAEQDGLVEEPPKSMSAVEYFENRFREMEHTWNDFAPGRGALLAEASKLLKGQPRRPDNWSGLDIASTLEQRLDRRPNPHGSQFPITRPSALFRTVYALLNRETHPHSARLEPDRIRGHQGGPVVFEFPGKDRTEQAQLADLLAAGSVNLGMVAFSLRFNMGGGA